MKIAPLRSLQSDCHHSFSTALLLLVAAGCINMPAELTLQQGGWQNSIIGGTASRETDYQAVGVTLTTGKVFNETMGGMVCTGTLIAPDVVLLAAHCTEVNRYVFMGMGQNIKNYFSLALNVADFGSHNVVLPAQTHVIREFVVHDGWDPALMDTMTSGLGTYNDIALAFLKDPMAGIDPAVVLEPDDVVSLVQDAEVEIVGYGQTDADDPYSAGVKYQAATFINELGETEMQIGDNPEVTPQKCHGDSGGPSFLSVSDLKEPARRLVGVTSHAYDESDCLKGGVDTRVDSFRSWIEQVMTSRCENGTRTLCENNGRLRLPGEPPVEFDAGVGADASGEYDSGRPSRQMETWFAAAPEADETKSAEQGCDATQGLHVSLLLVLIPLFLRNRKEFI